MSSTVIIVFAITLFFGGLHTWKSYYENIKAVQNEVINENYLINTYGPPNQVPEMAEGRNIKKMMPSKTINATFLGLSSMVAKKLHKKLPPYFISINMVIVLSIIIASILIMLIFKNVIRNNNMIMLYWINTVLLIEYLSPERYSYQDVLFMPVIALIMPILVYPFSYKWISISIILAFCIQFLVPSGTVSLLRLLLFSITVNSILFLYIWNKRRKRAELFGHLAN